MSRKIQVGRSLLQLCGEHDVALFRQFACDVAWVFTFCLSAQNRGILLLAGASPMTPLVPV